MRVTTSIVFACTFLFAACGGGSESAESIEEEQSACGNFDNGYRVVQGSIEPRFDYHSEITGITYPIEVYLPPGYHGSSDSYPVIYATDGQWVFDGFAGTLDALGVHAILVAIHEGPLQRRVTDYPWPGAETYFDFLTVELLPEIEQRYRVDTGNRTLQGASLGGLLVLTSMFLDDVEAPLFKHHISMDASLHYQQEAFRLEQERTDSNRGFEDISLVLTTATEGNFSSVGNMNSVLSFRQHEGLSLYYDRFDVCHDDVALPSFEFALDNLFLLEP